MSTSFLSHDYARFDQLAEEFVARYRAGERPPLQEYVERYPEMAAEIRELFPTLIEVELVEQAISDQSDGPSPPRDSSVVPLHQLGDYRVLREIGRGGMGVVYEAEQLSLSRRVALKILPRTIKQDNITLMRFRREARSAARLHHTNIVPVFDVGQDGDVVYYAMQLIQGQGLDLVVDELKRLRDESHGANRPRGNGSASWGWRSRRQQAVLPPIAPTRSVTADSRSQLSRQMAQSLLLGQFSTRVAWSAADFVLADSPVPADPVAADPTTAHSASGPELLPPLGRPTGVESAVLPGGAALSDSESSGSRLPFYRSVAEVGLQAAAGLAHAHDRGIIHRDIKPSNLMLDAAGVVWITDFGLAKSSDDSLTASGDVLGTLRYMAPERFKGEGDERADVYALGATLYELVTLRPAFDSPDRLQLIHQVQDQEPPRPRTLDPRIPRDLESIVLKAIEKEPKRRYASAETMGEDLRRFLNGEPIKARQVSEVERLWKWSRRRPAIAGLILLASLSLLIGTAVSALFALRANERASAARLAEAHSSASAKEAQSAREQAFVERDNSRRLSANLAVDRGLALADQGQPERGLHWLLHGLKNTPEAGGDFERMVRQNLNAWLDQVHQLVRTSTAETTKGDPRSGFFSPDGLSYITGGYYFTGSDSALRRWETATGRLLGTYPGLVFNDFSADGQRLVGHSQRCVRVIDLASDQPVWTSAPVPDLLSARFLGDGSRLIVFTRSQQDLVSTWQFWDAATGTPIGIPQRVKYSAGVRDRLLVFDSLPDGQIGVFEVDPTHGSRAEVLRIPNQMIDGADMAPDGQTIWVRSRLSSWSYSDTRTTLWNLKTRQSMGSLPTTNLRYLPASDRILSQSIRESQSEIRLCDPLSGASLGPVLRHDGKINSWQVSPGGRLALTLSNNGTTQLWKMAADSVPVGSGRQADFFTADRRTPKSEGPSIFYGSGQLGGHGQYAVHWSESLDGRAVAQITATSDGHAVGIPARHRHAVIRSVVFDRDGRRFATGSDPGTLTGEIRVFETATGRLLAPPMTHTNYVSALAFQPEGPLLAAGDYHGLVRLWDATTGKEVGNPLIQGAIVSTMAFSPDGKTLAVGHNFERAGKPGVQLWDVATGRPAGSLLRHATTVGSLAFRADGKVLIAADETTLRLWNPAQATAIGDPIDGEKAPVFRPDGKTFATAGLDGSIRLRDATTGALRATIFSGTSSVSRVAFRPDGQMVVAGFADGSVRLIDLATARTVGPVRSLHHQINDVAFAADGRQYMAVEGGKISRSWTVPEPLAVSDLDELTTQVEARTGYRMASGPALAPLNGSEWTERIKQINPSNAPLDLADEPAWHEPLLREAEENGQTFAALWHLNRLIPLRPTDWTLFARLAQIHSATDAYAAAAADYDQAERLATRDVVLDWQTQCVVRALRNQRPVEALWYLDRLVAARPTQWTLLEDRASVHGLLGHKAEQAADQARMLALNSEPVLVLPVAEQLAQAGRWSEAAQLLARSGRHHPLGPGLAQAWFVACLKAGDRAGYLEARAAILAWGKVPKSLGMQLTIANMLAFAPGDSDDTQRFRKWLDTTRAAQTSLPPQGLHTLANIRGGLSLRAGLPHEAITFINEGMAADKTDDPTDWAWLSMAYAASGDPVQARRWCDRLQAWTPDDGPSNIWNNEAMRLQIREAAAMVRDFSFPVDPFTP